MTPAISPTGRPSRFCSWYSKPPAVPRPMIGGRLKGMTRAATSAVSRSTAGEEAVDLRLGRLALLEGLERDDEEGAVRLRERAQLAEAGYRADVADARQPAERLLHLQRDLARPVQRGALGQLDLDEEGALVLLRQEARGRAGTDRDDPEGDGGEHGQAEQRDAHQPRDDRRVAVPHPVDAAGNVAHDAALRPVMRLQQDAAERRRERQRVDRREQHSDADGDRELAEQRARDARE